MSWLVAQVWDRVESVAFRLWQDGHETWPALDETAYRGDPENNVGSQKRIAERLPFAGYIFVRYSHRWHSAAHIWGVARILGMTTAEGLIPHMLPDDLIAAFAELPPEDERIDESSFAPGEWVRITAGPHAGLFGRFERVKHGHGIVTLDYFHRAVPVSIPLRLLANPFGASTGGGIRRTASA